MQSLHTIVLQYHTIALKYTHSSIALGAMLDQMWQTDVPLFKKWVYWGIVYYYISGVQ